jgi:predicted  nucleic acid-binding Zn-ribbon protein
VLLKHKLKGEGKMKTKCLAMSIVTMLILSIVLVAVPKVAAVPSGVSCKIDPEKGYVGTLVTASGIVYGVTPLGGRTIKIYWDVPFDINHLVATTTTESDGSYETTFNAPADFMGEHTVIAVDVGTGTQCPTTFKIKPKIVLCPFCGVYGDEIGVSGTGFPADTWICWTIDFDSGKELTNEKGTWTTTFDVDDVEPGLYCFRARLEDSDRECWLAKADFYVGPVLILDRDHGQPCEDISVKGCLPGLPLGTEGDIYFEGLDPCICEGGILDVGDIEVLSPCGYFEGTFHVPTIPTGSYVVSATDKDETVEAESEFYVVPCIEIDPTSGVVGDTITIIGRGYARNAEVTVWMTGLLPADVPLEALVCFYKLVNIVGAWDETNTWVILTVGYALPVAYAATDCTGYFEASFEIPECWGGYHPIVATDEECNANIIGGWEAFYECPVFPCGILIPDECSLIVNKPGILRVLPKIWTEPASGVSGQTITLYGQGLSAFEFYVWFTDLCHDGCPDIFEECGGGEIYMYKRCSGFVLDFGPNGRWIDGPYFPCMGLDYGIGHFILNGQFDDSWARESFGMVPYGSYSPLMLNPRGSLVSDGMSFCINVDVDYFKDMPRGERWDFDLTFAWEYRQVGCPFLTVPWLQPQDCELTAYRFDYVEIECHKQWPGEEVLDLNLEFFTYDYGEAATTNFNIERLGVDAGFDSEVILRRLDELEGRITGLVQNVEGNILATLADVKMSVESITLDEVLGGLAEIKTSLGTIQGTVVNIQGNLAFVQTDIGTIKVDLSNLDSKVVQLQTDISKLDASITAINGKLVTIETSLGTIQEDISSIDGRLLSVDGNLATIGTSIGTFTTSLTDINTKISVMNGNLAEVQTDVGTIKGIVTKIDGDNASVKTDIGEMKGTISEIKNDTGLQPATIGLSILAAIAAIAAAVMILRKVYLK